MSTFGDGTLKQEIFDSVYYLKQRHTGYEFTQAMLEVAMYLFDGEGADEEGYKRGYEQAMADVKERLKVFE